MRPLKSQINVIKSIPKYSQVLLKAIQTPLLLFFAFVGNAVTFSAAGLFFHFERNLNPNVKTYFDALWWSFSTVSTVGYGDITPLTTEGRLIGMALMIIGIVFIIGFTAILMSVVYGLTASEIAELEQVGKKEYFELKNKLDEILKKLD